MLNFIVVGDWSLSLSVSSLNFNVVVVLSLSLSPSLSLSLSHTRMYNVELQCCWRERERERDDFDQNKQELGNPWTDGSFLDEQRALYKPWRWLKLALFWPYSRCGALAKAQQLFDMYKSKDVSTWTSLIAGYSQIGNDHDALHYFERMQQASLSPNAINFVCALKACGTIGAVERGSKIHDQIAEVGFLHNNIKLGNALVGMYVKCGTLVRAQRMLEELPVRNAVSWNVLIAGYVEHGKGEQAFECFKEMQCEGLYPDAVTFICLLKACASMRAIDKGEKLHDEISKRGSLRSNIVLGSALVDMYAKCGAFAKAQQVLMELPWRNVVSWNALISGYADRGAGEQAWKCFEEMQREGLSPDASTFSSILKACKSMGTSGKGEEIHYEMSKRALPGEDIVLGNALLDMYARCGAFAKAEHVFEELPSRNVISWNTLICGYVEHGEGEQALICYEMMNLEGTCPNAITLTSILKACGSLGAVQKGEHIHEDVAKQGLLEKNVELGTALVDMYAKCGALTKAAHVLEELPRRDSISWSALVARYAEHEEGAHALNCFEQMLAEGLSPNAVTFASLLKACGSIGAVGEGERIHVKIVQQGLLENDAMLGNALIDMYAKCGALTKAQGVLQELPERDVISWTSLMGGLIKQCEGMQALNCFKHLQSEGLAPDAAMFSCILSAYSRLGLVEDASTQFEGMFTRYGINPDLEHYTCMVDAFGRAGFLNKAARVIEKLPSSDSGVWSALLGACKKWGDLNVARWAFEHSTT